ncbi:MAG: OmpH family outer membrane protein [Prevotellaceae bacterium]|jgi:outer membrane protein|nr:OmpH family outer membrane protein [Prevotellaceae bacterium]
MKKIFTLVIAAVIALSAGKVSAQSLKFGHINTQELIQAMPELESYQQKMQAYEKDLHEIIQDMQTDYQKKLNDFNDKQNTWSDAVKAAKQRELVDVMNRLREQSQNSEQDYARESQKLLEPIITKAREAINKVAKANGFTFIFDLSTNVLVYFNETQSTDLLPLVKKELNITK